MRYVIAGAGPAGISAARTLRQLDRDGEIVLVSKDDQVHSRCMLHKYLGGERDAEGISFIPPGFFNRTHNCIQERQWSGWTALRGASS